MDRKDIESLGYKLVSYNPVTHTNFRLFDEYISKNKKYKLSYWGKIEDPNFQSLNNKILIEKLGNIIYEGVAENIEQLTNILIKLELNDSLTY